MLVYNKFNLNTEMESIAGGHCNVSSDDSIYMYKNFLANNTVISQQQLITHAVIHLIVS